MQFSFVEFTSTVSVGVVCHNITFLNKKKKKKEKKLGANLLRYYWKQLLEMELIDNTRQHKKIECNSYLFCFTKLYCIPSWCPFLLEQKSFYVKFF